MSWLDNICVKKSHNCLRNDRCPPGSDCCAENNSNLGTCVAKGSCNTTTGHPTIPTSHKCPSENYAEGYTRGATEGYTGSGDVCSCNNWKWALILMIIIALMFGVGFVWIGIKYKR